MSFHICTRCQNPFFLSEKQCRHCGQRLSSRSGLSITALLGFSLIGCGNVEKNSTDSGVDSGIEPSIEPSNVEPPYGVGEMDWDGDGFLVDVDDCDDEDSNAYPGAAPLDSATACMRDFDGDGYGDMEPINSEVQPGTDCDDMDININPGTNDTPGDGIDSNCDGED